MFLLVHITPVDPAVIIAGDYATLDQIVAIRPLEFLTAKEIEFSEFKK